MITIISNTMGGNSLKRLTLSSFLLMALVFTGCGGGGNDSTPTSDITIMADEIVSIEENKNMDLSLGEKTTDIVKYEISDFDSSYFNLNSTTGKVTFKNTPDYEVKSQYSFLATAINTEDKKAQYKVIINIINIDESPDNISDNARAFLYLLSNDKFALLYDDTIEKTSSENRSLRNISSRANSSSDIQNISKVFTDENNGYSSKLYEKLKKDTFLLSSLQDISDNIDKLNEVKNLFEKINSNNLTASDFIKYIELISEIAPEGAKQIIAGYSAMATEILEDIDNLNTPYSGNKLDNLSISVTNKGSSNTSNVKSVNVHYRFGTNSDFKVLTTSKSSDKYIANYTNYWDEAVENYENGGQAVNKKVLIEVILTNGKTIRTIKDLTKNITVEIPNPHPLADMDCKIDSYSGKINCSNKSTDDGELCGSKCKYKWSIDGNTFSTTDLEYTVISEDKYVIVLEVIDEFDQKSSRIDEVKYDSNNARILFSIGENISNKYYIGEKATFLIDTIHGASYIKYYKWTMTKEGYSEIINLGEGSATSTITTKIFKEVGKYTIKLVIKDDNDIESTQIFPIIIAEQEDTTAPVFEDNKSFITVEIDEKQKEVITVKATDNISEVRYFIDTTEYEDGEKFNIDETSGKLTFKVAPLYADDSSYTLVILAKDDSDNLKQQIIRVTLQKVETNILNKPKNVNATDGTYSDKLIITWDKVDGATYYELYKSSSSTGDYKITNSSPLSTTTTTRTPELNTKKYFKVKACNDKGCSEFSDYDSGYADVPETTTQYTHNISAGTIASPTGKVWMDKNLGATTYCSSFDDSNCYGDYYQWGRNADGHEKSNSSETSSKSNSLIPTHGNFIKGSSDWTYTDSDGTTRKTNWNPCPSGYRIPTIDELLAESIDDRADAYNKLKLPSAGGRSRLRWFYVQSRFLRLLVV
jgi:hypothetical protein